MRKIVIGVAGAVAVIIGGVYVLVSKNQEASERERAYIEWIAEVAPLPSPFPTAFEFDGEHWKLRDGCEITGDPTHVRSLRIQCEEHLWPE